MTRPLREDIAGEIYHIMNKSALKAKIFIDDSDYFDFMDILRKTLEFEFVKIYAYCIMPNHWHFLVSPNIDGGVGKFVHALASRHTRFVRSKTDTVGLGPIYKGRYKSVKVSTDISVMRVMRYVERNAVRANLSKIPSEWKFCSAWARENNIKIYKSIVTYLPKEIIEDYGGLSYFINAPDNDIELSEMRNILNNKLPVPGTK